jgi:hypothetical protein
MTRQRIRSYATLLAIVSWAVWLWDISAGGNVDRLGKVKGTDFLQFYVAGSFVRDGRLPDYYDVQAQYARARAIAPGSSDTFYMPVQSPQTALVFAPLAALPYARAVGVWLVLVMLLYAAACWLIWRHCDALRAHRAEVLAAATAFPGLYTTVLYGQTSVVTLVAVSGALAALWRDRRVVAGLALGCLAFKPHWLAAAAAVFVVAAEWRVVAGVLASAAAQLGVTYAVAGAAAMNGYWRILASAQRMGDLLEPRPGDSLRSFFKVFVPSDAAALVLYAATGTAVLAIAARTWRSGARFELRASAVVLATILVSPHTLAYDLILLAPVFLLLGNVLAAEPPSPRARVIVWSMAAMFVAPLLAVLPPPIRLQFSVTAMALLLCCVRDADRSMAAAPAA